MTPNPFATLLHSRKFWLLVLDMIISLVTYFSVKYLAPAAVDDILEVLKWMQLIFALVIGSIAYEDGKQIQASADIEMWGKKEDEAE